MHQHVAYFEIGAIQLYQQNYDELYFWTQLQFTPNFHTKRA